MEIAIVLIVLGLTTLAFVKSSALLHAVCIIAWLLLGYFMYNQPSLSALNTYLPTALMILALSMVIVHIVKVVTQYMGSRTEPPTYEEEQRTLRSRISRVTRRRGKPPW